MAKAVVAAITLVMLGVWGWYSWGEYGAMMGDPKSPTGFVEYVLGTNWAFNDRHGDQPGVPGARTSVRLALGAILALSATLFFAVTGGSGTIFSVMVTAFVSFLAAAANMVFALVFVGMVAWTTIEELELDTGPLSLSIGVYAVLLYSGVVILASFAAMRQLPQMVRGRKEPMKGVMKSLLILMAVSGGLGPFGVIPQFAIAGFSGFYWLAGLCLLSLMFISLTHSNYEYD